MYAGNFTQLGSTVVISQCSISGEQLEDWIAVSCTMEHSADGGQVVGCR